MIDCRSLVAGYDGRPVVRDLDLVLPSQQSLVVLGHNGAGKTTLLKTLFGFLEPLGGSFKVLNLTPPLLSPRELIQSGARYLGQGPRGFPDLTIRESRVLLQRIYGVKEGVEDVASGTDGRRKIGRLSVGQRRLEALRLLSAGAPKLYLLDEPTAGLDPRAKQEVLGWLGREQARGASLVIVEQRFRDVLQMVDLALILRRGKATFVGDAEELQSDERLVHSYL